MIYTECHTMSRADSSHTATCIKNTPLQTHFPSAYTKPVLPHWYCNTNPQKVPVQGNHLWTSLKKMHRVNRDFLLDSGSFWSTISEEKQIFSFTLHPFLQILKIFSLKIEHLQPTVVKENNKMPEMHKISLPHVISLEDPINL